MTDTTAPLDPEHVHAYQPNGQVRETAIAYSPRATSEHTLYDKVFSVGLCPCGSISRVHVANENVRSQAEQWRRDAARG